MSQDNLVTPRLFQTYSHVDWLARSLSLAAVPLLRLRNIERMYGTIRRISDRCGCQRESRFPSPVDRAVLWFALEPIEPVRQVLMATPCRVLPVGWLVLSPDGGRFSWAEMLEIQNRNLLSSFEEIDLFSKVMTLEEWENFGRSEIRFKTVHGSDRKSENPITIFRNSLIREIMNRNANFSHVNLSLEETSIWNQSKVSFLNSELVDLDVEILRDRLIPVWRQSGDMAFASFKTYTITRKDI